MSALAIGGIVLACVFGGALFGMFLPALLPTDHLSANSKDVVKVATAMIATLAALVIGLLIASAKNSFDAKDSQFKHMAAHVILLDRVMAQYGPETREARDLLRQMVITRLHQIWPDEKDGTVEAGALGEGGGVETIQVALRGLAPQNDNQRSLQASALQISGDIAEARWLLLQEIRGSIQWPFLAVLVFWLAVIFMSFGLSAPRNTTVIIALLVSALSVAGSIFLIVQMDQPYGGLIRISSAPLHLALDELGKP
ncbi:Protein of unknown function [Rhizobiales bacterium GAS191]|jgi:hypothetical protein|nr:Protein of unknown function [Rhizobiales bacterium GAS113]SEC26477.1 Protein of unknown function [Rhizobiales bacterium GAS188]SEC98878.1 Protein of unknown function [Rhizobiales bacterium GAS191]